MPDPTLPMRTLGATGLTLTEIGFGSAPIGNLYAAIDDLTAEDAVDAAWDAGIRYFDTAPHYGLGLAERRLGQALKIRRREDYVVSTKVGRLLVPNPTRRGSDLPVAGFDVPDTLTRVVDFSADGVRRSLDESLERLGLDRIDIVLVHDPDEHVEQTIRETIPALVKLRNEGIVRAVGVGMNQWQAPLDILRQTDIDTVMLAGRWTLTDRTGARLLDAAAERGIGILAAAPYNSGLLARDWPADDATFNYARASVDVLARARRFASAAQSAGLHLPDLALQFPLRHPAVTSVVVGLRTAQEAQQTRDRAVAPIPDDLWSQLDRT